MFDKIKDLLFTHRERTSTVMTPAGLEQLIANRAIQSQALRNNKIFQDAASELYLSLCVSEDSLEPTSSKSDSEAKELRLQRRMLMQLLARLDNNIVELEKQAEAKRLELESQQEGE